MGIARYLHRAYYIQRTEKSLLEITTERKKEGKK